MILPALLWTAPSMTDRPMHPAPKTATVDPFSTLAVTVAAPKPVVTYVSMQNEPAGAGARLSDEDHAALVAGLQGLQREGLISEFHVVKGNGSVGVHGWEWADRMTAIARSSVSIHAGCRALCM